ncbi:MAG: M48 family metalloprotease [Candidatus Hodarchaeota archaeon]
MKNAEITIEKIKLPLSDWVLVIVYIICFPVFICSPLFIISILMVNSIDFFIIIAIISSILLLIIGYYYIKTYIELKSYALEVNYFQFIPSWRDLILNLLRQFYQILFYFFVFYFLINLIIGSSYQIGVYFAIAILTSLVFQIRIILISMRMKKELLATAQESIKPEIKEYLEKNHPNSHQISEFRFADIQVASLFLSAGVMTYGYSSHICLISRYFNWKLTDEELISVLSHEEGHIAKKHPKKQYIILGTEGILRNLRIFYVLAYIVLIRDIFSSISNEILFFGSAFLLILVSGSLALIQYYRIFIQEIRADSYAGQLVGNIEVANTLKKLPKVIPAPISPGQTDFLGFRISLLRHWEKIRSKI